MPFSITFQSKAFGCELSLTPCGFLFLLCAENIRERYGSLTGELHMIELEKGRSGLGLSLAGNKDRSRMSVFIVGIDPNGAAGKDGQLQIADELLEVSSYGKHCIYSHWIGVTEPSVSRKPTWVSYGDWENYHSPNNKDVLQQIWLESKSLLSTTHVPINFH